LSTKLRERLIRSEGWKNKMYTDTVGKVTIGVGFNLTDVGLLDEEINFILDNRIRLVKEFLKTTSFYKELDPVRQGVIEDMCFNLGPEPFDNDGFKDWPVFTLQLTRKDYRGAAANMRATLWAKQVGPRAVKLARIMETGVDEA
jgi:lysozyme